MLAMFGDGLGEEGGEEAYAIGCRLLLIGGILVTAFPFE